MKRQQRSCSAGIPVFGVYPSRPCVLPAPVSQIHDIYVAEESKIRAENASLCAGVLTCVSAFLCLYGQIGFHREFLARNCEQDLVGAQNNRGCIMLRRLFFLIPQVDKARQAVEGLAVQGVGTGHIHAIAQGMELGGLPVATKLQKNDTTLRLERFVWVTSLVMFVAAMLALLVGLLTGLALLSLMSLLVMLLSFIAGEQVAVRVPNVHLSEFTDALSHGEILLMVDVPGYRVAEIENYMHQRHPESVAGGASWTMDAFGL
jgi:hypothetical protein